LNDATRASDRRPLRGGTNFLATVGSPPVAYEAVVGCGQQSAVDPSRSWFQGDGNADGAVNSADLAIWRQQFGVPVVAVVPEPNAILLMLAALAAGAVLRSR
jgi:hypothetical protein